MIGFLGPGTFFLSESESRPFRGVIVFFFQCGFGSRLAPSLEMIYRSSFRKNKIYFHIAVQLSVRRFSPYQIDLLWLDLAKRIQRHHFLTAHSCVLMSNHFHGLFEVPESFFEIAESTLKAEFSQVQEAPLNCELDEAFRMVRISCFAAYREIYRYIYRNPLEAGLCSSAEQYPYSSLAELLGLRRPIHAVADRMGVITNPFHILDWINNTTGPGRSEVKDEVANEGDSYFLTGRSSK